MQLSLKNVGIIRNATIEISGITVIAGENGSGKSTIGKALYAIFSGLYNIDTKVKEERIKTIVNYLRKMEKNSDISALLIYEIFRPENARRQKIAKEIVNIFNRDEVSYEKFKDILLRLEKEYDNDAYEKLNRQEIEKTIQDLYKALQLRDNEIINKLVKKTFDMEFSKQVGNIFSDSESRIDLEIKGDVITACISSEREMDIINPKNLWAQPVYLDDPFILDTPPNEDFMRSGETGHKLELKKKLFVEKNNITVSEELIVEEKIEHIYEKINTICDGTVIQKGFNEWAYEIDGKEKTLALKNLSAGLKTFSILKLLLINGVIEDSGTIILDEPEIHLHPKWQLIFAEIIVLLQKEFGLHILLNSHSPYFLYAVEVYSQKYEILDKCKYYLTTLEDGCAKIEDVTLNTRKIYNLLATPFQTLEDELYSND